MDDDQKLGWVYAFCVCVVFVVGVVVAWLMKQGTVKMAVGEARGGVDDPASDTVRKVKTLAASIRRCLRPEDPLIRPF